MNSAAPGRPRVLLVDDHIDFLESVRHRLADAFDIVGIAYGGRQALELARRLRPDVVVLDVAMPDLNGFQTLELLRRDDPDIRVVFLTMHRDDDFVTFAINAGARGYVLKSRTSLDLISAIDQALEGRLFVPSLTSLSTIAGSRHAVHFHAGDSDFLDDVSQLVDATFRSGERVVLVASEATRTGVAQRLQARQRDLAMLAERGQYVAEDSALALSRLMDDGRVDETRVAEMVHCLHPTHPPVPNGPGGRLTIVGDMSAVLCANGQFEAALTLERTWDDLTRALPFLTVCIYPIDCFEHSGARNALPNVCAQHSAVTSGVSSQGPRHIY